MGGGHRIQVTTKAVDDNSYGFHICKCTCDTGHRKGGRRRGGRGEGEGEGEGKGEGEGEERGRGREGEGEERGRERESILLCDNLMFSVWCGLFLC